MSYTTYSFNDIYMTLSAPGFPAYVVNGQGVGEIGIAYNDDNTAHDRAADGNVMVSKIEANNGAIHLITQQTSALHKYLKQVFNALKGGPTTNWAGMKINISSPAGTFDSIQAVGVSFAKRADQPYQAQGQMVTWNFMAANIQYQL